MKVRLAYGDDGLEVDLPDDATTVIEPTHRRALERPDEALREALRRPIASSPLRTLVPPGSRVAISVCDITRAQPRQLVLEAVLRELEGVVAAEDVTVLVATGTHRANSEEELRTMLGDEIVELCRVVIHDCRDQASMIDLGPFESAAGGSLPVALNREWVEADVRITTGFVEPHFFAGFSGGPKMIAPGLASLDTVAVLHDARHIGHSSAVWGVIEGNPIQDDIRAIARHPMAAPHFAIDVTLDREQRVTEVFAGELFAMHREACASAREVAMCGVDEPFEVVVTTNSGYPLDQNLYQTVKGISAAAQVVRGGPTRGEGRGVIVCAAECRDGIPDHGRYGEMLRAADSLEEALAEIEGREGAVLDQWQVQVQALIQRRADIWIKSDGLSPDQLRSAHFEPVDDVGQAARRALKAAGKGARLCVLPEGPQTIPYVSGARR